MRKKYFFQLLATAIAADINMLTMDSELNEIWDSLGQISVLALLNQEFQVLLTMEELVKIKKVSDIFTILHSRGINLE